jgi:hypothetical protein
MGREAGRCSQLGESAGQETGQAPSSSEHTGLREAKQSRMMRPCFPRECQGVPGGSLAVLARTSASKRAR